MSKSIDDGIRAAQVRAIARDLRSTRSEIELCIAAITALRTEAERLSLHLASISAQIAAL